MCKSQVSNPGTWTIRQKMRRTFLLLLKILRTWKEVFPDEEEKVDRIHDAVIDLLTEIEQELGVENE